MAYLERYKNWVRLHAGKLSLLEGTVDALTWLLPDRFSDSEFALEAINSALGLISVLNGYLIAQDGVRSEESGKSRRLMWPILLGALQNVSSYFPQLLYQSHFPIIMSCFLDHFV